MLIEKNRELSKLESATEEELSSFIIVIKYGGNAMIDEDNKKSVLSNIKKLKEAGFLPILVHGGGPFIQKILEEKGIESEFIGGQRVTTKESMKYVEHALKGVVNSDLVGILNRMGVGAVGITGKDGAMALAEKRYHIDESGKSVDIGQVGNIKKVNPAMIYNLLKLGLVPVMAPIASDESGEEYNINADIFAGELAASLKSKYYIVLTDVDGLYEDIKNPESLIRDINIKEMDKYESFIVGGMLPKMESCISALRRGVKNCFITSGISKDSLLEKITGESDKRTLIREGGNNEL
jgi:acetylglutamate kinase